MKRMLLITTAVLAAGAILVLRSAADPVSGVDNPPTLIVHADIPVVPLQSYKDLATDCVDAIVTGIQPAYSSAGLGCTAYTVTVQSSARGVVTGTQRVLVGGSEHTWPIVRVPAAPTLAEGERFVAFLTGTPGDDLFLLGLGQGLYRVHGEGGSATLRGLHAGAGMTPGAFLDLVAE